MKKFAIVYGNTDSDIQRTAVAELTRILLEYTMEYPVCLQYEENADLSAFRCMYIGTRDSNPYIRKHSQVQLSTKEEYHIQVRDDTVLIEGFDDAGVLYGVMDFYCKYIVKHEYPHDDRYWVNFMEEKLPDFACGSAPSVRDRGLWTWGHVVYDYRGYLDHMMRLKMNTVIIWNDFLPVNAGEIVAYAHARNIKVIWGYAWLWDTDCNRFDLRALEDKPGQIFAQYEREYAHAGGDGIYFQTFTELGKDNIDGVLIAEAAANFVNQTSQLFFEKYPDMEIQFGLHATSVKNQLKFIAEVDPRVRIVWEDCGAFPFDYQPGKIKNFEETKAFVQTIGTLRGEKERFGAVTKGLVKLDWSAFEHLKGPQHMGVSPEYVKANRVERKRRIWRYIQAQWFVHADKALEMVKEMACLTRGEMCICALVEDGMFEENIMYPAALYGEMLWDAEADIKTLMREVALRSYVKYA